MKVRMISIGTAATLLLMASFASAHHSWGGVYDNRKSVTIRGVVTEFLFRSPHLALHMEVVNEETSAVEQWVIEWGSPRRAAEAGYDATVFSPGDELVITGQPAWTPGRKSVRMRELTRPADGFTLGGR